MAPSPAGRRGSSSCCRAVGALRLVRAAFSFPLDDPGDVRLSRELEGGALMDVGCYCVSGSRLVAGEPLEVSAFEVVGGDGVDARLAATLRFEGDVLGHFDCALDSANRQRARGHRLGRHARCWRPLALARAGDRDARCRTAPSSASRWSREDPYACELRDFAAAVAGERKPLLGRDDALGQARTICGAVRERRDRAARRGRRVASSSMAAVPRTRRSACRHRGARPALGPRRDRPARTGAP